MMNTIYIIMTTDGPNTKPLIVPGWVPDHLVPEEVRQQYFDQVATEHKRIMELAGYRPILPHERVIYILNFLRQFASQYDHIIDYMVQEVATHKYDPVQFLERVDNYVPQDIITAHGVIIICNSFMELWGSGIVPTFVPTGRNNSADTCAGPAKPFQHDRSTF